MFVRCVFAVVIVVLSVGFNPGQGFDNTTSQQQNSPTRNDQIHQLSFLNRSESEYKLGGGDLIQVSVFGIEDFKYSLRVNSRGEITLPFLGKVNAANLTPAELEYHLKTRLESGLIHNAQVSVFVQEYRSQAVFILGAVVQPGQYQIIHQLNLVDILAMAGGLDVETAGDLAIVQRMSPSQTPTSKSQFSGSGEQTLNVRKQGSKVIEVDLKALLDGKNLSLNVPIKGGDVINVPPRKKDLFYVVGEVNRAGAYEIPRKNNVFVSQAIAWAGGPLKTADTKKGILVRYKDNGGREELEVNFRDIMKGRKSDFAIQPNDIVFIPGSMYKTLGYGLIGAIPSAASGALVYGPIAR